MPGSTLQDLTGHTFGRLTVVERTQSKAKANGKFRTMWLCQCDCGRVVTVAASKLKGGQTKSCGRKGCKTNNHIEDHTGKKYGRLTVIERAPDHIKPNGNTDTMWLCECECGTYVVKRGQYLKGSKCASCGCWKSERTAEARRNDLTGLRFGSLTVVGFSHTHRTNGGDNAVSMWKCRCDCGNTKIIRACSLTTGNTQSCGCAKLSHGEMEIIKYLNQNKVYFKREYTFRDFRSEFNRPYRFDFALIDKHDKSLICLIEYQGKQHFMQTGSGKFAGFGKQQREVTDILKVEYCNANNIPLYTINYSDEIKSRLSEIVAIHVNPVPSVA